MDWQEKKILAARLRGLSVFRGELENGAPMGVLAELLDSDASYRQLELLGAFCYGLAPWEGDFSRFLKEKFCKLWYWHCLLEFA